MLLKQRIKISTNKLLALLVFLGLILTSLFIGVTDVDPINVWHNSDALNTLLVSRVPRTVAIILSAMALTSGGFAMQLVMRNSFVEPATTGTPQGIALGLILISSFYPNSPIIIKMLVGGLFGLISLILFLLITEKIPRTTPILIPLTGMIYSGIVGACMIFIAYENDMLQFISIWMTGEFSSVIQGQYEILWVSLIGLVAIYFLADQLTIINISENANLNFGVKAKYITNITLILIAFTSSCVVVSVGMIAFLGLVTPNIVRIFIGDNLRKSLPWCAWLGSVLLLVSDILGRIIFHPFEVPISLIFGIIGSSLFIAILWKHNHN